MFSSITSRGLNEDWILSRFAYKMINNLPFLSEGIVISFPRNVPHLWIVPFPACFAPFLCFQRTHTVFIGRRSSATDRLYLRTLFFFFMHALEHT